VVAYGDGMSFIFCFLAGFVVGAAVVSFAAMMAATDRDMNQIFNEYKERGERWRK